MMMGWGLGAARPMCLDDASAAPEILATTVFTDSVAPGVSPYSFNHTQTGSAILVLVAIKGSSDAGGGSALTMTVAYGGSNVPEEVSNTANIFATNPTVRAYLLDVDVPQGVNAVEITFSSAQDAQCIAAVVYDLDAIGSVGATALISNATDQSSTSLAIDRDVPASLTIGMVAVLGGDTNPFTPGTLYTSDRQGDTGASTTTDIGYMAQSRIGGSLFDASWAVADNHGAVALELISSDQEAAFGIESGSPLAFLVRTSVATDVTCRWGDGGVSTIACPADTDVLFAWDYLQPFTGRFRLSCAAGLDKISYFWAFAGGSLERFTAAQLGRLRGLLLFSNDKPGAELSGNVRDLPRSLSILAASETTLMGDIGDLPPDCWLVALAGGVKISGDIANIPPGAGLVMDLQGQNTLFGDLADINPAVVSWNVAGNNTISGYSGSLWRSSGITYLGCSSASSNLSAGSVDQIIIDMAAQSPLSPNGVLDLGGGNAARTSASDAALATLVAAGWTVITS